MKVFNSQNYMDTAFTALEKAASPHSNIFLDSISSNAFSKKPRIGALVLQAKEITADTSSVMRQESSPALSALGATTCFNTLQGVFSLEKACHFYSSADAMHDEKGKWIAISDITLRIGQIFGGLCFILVRFADIANRGFNSFKVVALPAAYALAIGVHCFAVLYIGLTALSVISIRETSQFLKKVEKANTNADALKALIGDLTGEGAVDPFRKISKEDVYLHLGQALRSVFNEINPELVAKLSDKKLGKALFKEQYHKFLPTVLNRMGIFIDAKDLTAEQLEGNENLTRIVWAKERKSIHERVLGSKGMGFVEKAKEMHLYEMLSNKDTKQCAEAISKDLLQDLRTCSKKQRHVMIAYLITGVVGTAFTIVSDVFLTPLGTMISTIGFLVCYLVMGYGDGLCFLETYKSGGPIGEYAKPYVWLHFALGLAAITTAIALTTVTGGIFPIACIVVIGGIWMAMDIWMLRLLEIREKEYNEQHPTLQKFLDQLNATQLDWITKETLEMFQKLPKIQREAILRLLLESKESSMKVYAKKLEMLFMQEGASQETIEEKGKRFYQEIAQDLKMTQKAFKKANESLIGETLKPLDKDNLNTHPCRHIFYKTLYNELAKTEQQKLCKKVGKARLISAVKKLIDSETPYLGTQKIETVATHSLPELRAG